MRRGSRSEGSGVSEGSRQGLAFLLTRATYTDLINWTRERVCLFVQVWGRAVHMHEDPLFSHIYWNLQVWGRETEREMWGEKRADSRTHTFVRPKNPENINVFSILVGFNQTPIQTKLGDKFSYGRDAQRKKKKESISKENVFSVILIN